MIPFLFCPEFELTGIASSKSQNKCPNTFSVNHAMQNRLRRTSFNVVVAAKLRHTVRKSVR